MYPLDPVHGPRRVRDMPAAVSSVVSYGVGGAMLAVAWLEWTQNRCTHPRVLLELAVALLFAWVLRGPSSSKPEGRCEAPAPPELLVSAQDGASEAVRKMKEHGDRTDYQARARARARIRRARSAPDYIPRLSQVVSPPAGDGRFKAPWRSNHSCSSSAGTSSRRRRL